MAYLKVGQTLPIPSTAGHYLQTRAAGPLWESASNYSFAAYLDTSMSGLSQDTYYKVNFNVEETDVKGIYDNSSNYRMTTPAGYAGYWFFTSNVVWHGWGGSNTTYDTFNLQLRINNTTKAHSTLRLEPDMQHGQNSCDHIIILAVSDYVEVYALSQQGAGTGNITGGSGRETRFAGTYLGAA